jgi:hypothetical protein
MVCAVFDSQDTEKLENLNMRCEASPRETERKHRMSHETHTKATRMIHKTLPDGSTTHVRALELAWFVLILTLFLTFGLVS